MELRGFMHEMILTELEDAVGVENVSHSSDQKLAYGTDYFWLARMTVDKGGNPALPDYVVRPGCAEEVSKVLKIANYYKLPVQTWGGGSGSQGGAQQIASRIGCDEIDLLLLFRDPLNPKPHEPNDNDLLRLCDVHNIPFATNIATAEALIRGVERGDFEWREIVNPRYNQKK